MAKVTFLMMAYNTEKYIEKAVKSVLNQTESDINIYIRNNGSTDKTGDILDKLAKEDKRIHVTTNKVNSVSDEGIKPFQRGWWPFEEGNLGEYISIIDSDDWIEPNFVEVLYSNAKTNNSDIVLAGCNFINEQGQVVGVRNLPEAVTDNLHAFGNYFPYLYNGMRTWWGKLFKKEFFLKEYDKVWTPQPLIWYQEPMSWKMDTLIMLDYLKLNPRVSCISNQFYNFLIRTTSEYNIRRPERRFLMDAYTLYISALSLLKQYDLETPENLDFIQNIHWAFIKEIVCNVVDCKNMEPIYRYRFLEDIVIDDINALYQKKKVSEIILMLKPILEKLENKYVASDFNIYTSFMARINKYIDILDADNSNPIAFIVIMSVLCEQKNRHMFGEKLLLMPFETRSQGVKKSLEFQHQIRKWWTIYPQNWVNYINSIDENDELKELEKKIIENYNANKYDEVLALAIEILERNPVNLKALICVILVSKKTNDNVLANLLEASIAVIWDNNSIENIKKEIEGI